MGGVLILSMHLLVGSVMYNNREGEGEGLLEYWWVHHLYCNSSLL